MQTNKAHSKAPASESRGLSPWLKLALAIAVVGVLMFIIGPQGLRLPGFRQIDALIAGRDLKATAIYYTDLEEFAKAESALRDAMTYAPDEQIQPNIPRIAR